MITLCEPRGEARPYTWPLLVIVVYFGLFSLLRIAGFMPHCNNLSLVGDIGGTNARFALLSGPSRELHHVAVLPCARYSGPAEAIEAYLTTHAQGERPGQAVLAFACPVSGDTIKMTNNHWQFSQTELRSGLDLQRLRVVGDFYAQAMAMPTLKPAQKLILREGKAQPEAPILVFGPGTGLGMATLVSIDGRWHPLTGEGGHTNLPARSPLEEQIVSYLRGRFEVVTCEHLCSGPGLENLYAAYSTLFHWDRWLTATDITTNALNREPNCMKVVEHFIDWMGCVAGNAALTTGTFGGVYLTGGILPQIKELLAASHFLDAFDDKGVMHSYNRNIPVTLNLEPLSGLVGAAAALAYG